MKEIMLEETPVEMREQILKDSCDQIIERSYVRHFTSDELNGRKDELANACIQLDELEKKLSDIRSEYKGKIKPLEDRIARLTADIRMSGEMVHGDCYKFVDPDERRVGIYTPEGRLIEERPITPEDRQMTLHGALRNGTEG